MTSDYVQWNGFWIVRFVCEFVNWSALNEHSVHSNLDDKLMSNLPDKLSNGFNENW